MNSERMAKIGELLRELRENNGLTQDFVASKLNITRSAYSYYELGKTEPSLKSLTILAKIFNVNPDYFLAEETRDLSLSDSGIRYNVFHKTPASMTTLTPEERQLIALFRLATAKEKRKIFKELDKQPSDIKK